MAKISIIVPVYNVEKYLRQALDSVCSQTFEDFEVICIDDCSPDNSLSILREYEKKDKRFKVIHLEKNGGQGKARNLAITLATGKYIMFLDPDDWYEPNTFENLYNQIEKYDNDLVFFGMYLYDEDKKRRKITYKRLKPFENVSDKNTIILSELKEPFIVTCEVTYKIYKKDFLIKNDIKFSDVRIAEDILFSVKCLCLAKTVSVLNEPFYNYRKHFSTTKQYQDKCLYDDFKGRELAYECAKNAHPNILKSFLVYYIKAMFSLEKKYYKLGAYKKFFYKMKEVFVLLNQNHNISAIAEYINYKEFIRVVNFSYIKVLLYKFMDCLFAVDNYPAKSHKVITICGIKIKIKK